MMSRPHPVFDTPPDHTVVWRYMDFTKFVDLLERSAMFFSAADKLGDAFEGATSDPTPAALRAVYADAGIPTAMIDRIMQTNAVSSVALRRSMCVLCWHMNEHESAAMWKLYTRTNEAIAIRSTFGRLRACLPGDEKVKPCVHIGKVRYIDYTRDLIPSGNLFWPFVHKRQSFAHEAELRAIVFDPAYTADGNALDWAAPRPPGISIPVDLARLIDGVYVAPTCPLGLRISSEGSSRDSD